MKKIMDKRRLEVTVRPTYILTSEGRKIFLREIDDQEPDKPDLYELVTEYFLPVLFLGSGWLLAAAILLFPINVM